MVHCFHPMAWVRQMKLILDKPDIDLRPLMTFEAQTGHSDCNITCKRIMKRMGVIPEGASVNAEKFPFKVNGVRRRESYYQLADENEERDELIFRDDNKSKEAYKYLDKSLEYGHPILIGVNHTYAYRSNKDYINETTTDHYVIIVGRKYVDGTQRYIFWDVGTRRGESTEWFFEQEVDNKLIANKTYKNPVKPYTVIQIRRNKDENGEIINY